MGKKDTSGGLGRALVRQHNQLVRDSKDKGSALRHQGKKVLESVTEVSDIEAILERAEEGERAYALGENLLISLDANAGGVATSSEEKREQQKQEEALYASCLRVPRRPPWNAEMSVEELDSNERQAFLVWRRSLARLEENEKLVLTPFEKNLDIWRQLWRVLERSDLLVMVVDARDPLFYRCLDLEVYAREIDEHKRTLLLVNKADLLPLTVRQRWAKYFQLKGILFIFWSAKAASASLEGRVLSSPWEEQISSVGNSVLPDTDTTVYGRDGLLARLQTEAEAFVSRRDSNKTQVETNYLAVEGQNSLCRPVVVGFVGYPNVGKSSTINALVGEKRTGVTSTPGKTKHFQTLRISDKLVLCDCPGLVFPSFSSSRYKMIASGVLPIDRMTEHREAVQVVANQVSRHLFEGIYNIALPRPKSYEQQSRPPSASELLRAYCSSRGLVSSSGLPDETRAARQILKDYVDGKLPHFEMPPGMTDEDYGAGFMPDGLLGGSNSLTSYQSDSSDPNDIISSGNSVDAAGKLDVNRVVSELLLSDMANAESSTSAAASSRKKASAATHKLHRKPQRKKDRSWRVENDNGDGMPVVRVFQKPAVNLGSIKA